MAGETPETLSLGRYLTTSSFAQAVTENWQSEYLQFTLFILLTVWFVQKGSPESKQPGEEGGETDAEQMRRPARQARLAALGEGRRLAPGVYSNSLVLVMAHDLALVLVRPVGVGLERVQRRAARARAAVALLAGYLGSADFWETTLQNWQSEFLAVGSMAVLAIYLRQRGSPESKPVGCPHHSTGGGLSRRREREERASRCGDADVRPARHQDRRAQGAAPARRAQGRASTPAGRPSTAASTSATPGRSSSSPCSSASSPTRATTPTLVANITDINDKIYDAARPAGRPSGELAAEMTARYLEDTSGSGSAARTTSRRRRRWCPRSSR